MLRLFLWIPVIVVLPGCFECLPGERQRSIVDKKNADYVAEHDMATEVHFDDNPLVRADSLERVVSTALLLGKAALSLVVPFNQSADYSAQMLMPSKNLSDPQVLAGLGVLALWTLALVESWKRRLPALGPLLLLAPAWLIPSNTVLFISYYWTNPQYNLNYLHGHEAKFLSAASRFVNLCRIRSTSNDRCIAMRDVPRCHLALHRSQLFSL